jgi:hypothetical protein
MPPIGCPECGCQISSAAEACPQCGHPNQLASRAAAGPTCYACQLPATTRCQRCGARSCVEHLQNVYVQHMQGGAYELRCGGCFASARTWKIIGGIITVTMLVLMVLFVSWLGSAVKSVG